MKIPSTIVTLLFVQVLSVGLYAQTSEPKADPKLNADPGGLTQLTAADTPLRKGDKIAFYGDSVTMQSLLEKEKPTIVVIYLGISDVWHGEKGYDKI